MKRKIFKLSIIIFIIFIGFVIYTSSIDIKNDYYSVINRDSLKKNHLKDGEYSWSVFSDAQDKANIDVDRIVENIISGSDTYQLSTSSIHNMNVLYNDYMNVVHRNDVGLGPLKEYIDLVMKTDDISSLIRVGIRIEKELHVSIFSNLEVGTDFLNHDKNIVYFYPLTFAFGSSADIYSNDDYMAYKAYIKRGIHQLLLIYGYNKLQASSIAGRLISFYEKIAAHSYSKEYLSDVSHYYNVLSIEEINNLYSHIDINEYLENRIGKYLSVYSVVDEGQIEYFNSLLNQDNLEDLKYYVFMQILSNYANYLSVDYEDVVVELNNSILEDNEEKTLEKKAREMVSEVFSQDVDAVFSKSFVQDENRKKIEELFVDIQDSFSDILKENTWLSANTKKYALDKLKKMKLVIDIHELEQDLSGVRLFGKSFIEDIILIQDFLWNSEMERLGNGKKILPLGDSVVNAFYQPQDNSVYIPSAFFYLIDSTSDYSMLGSVGMILAHEVTHGFDANGSLFDSVGNYYNWWNDLDRKHFLELKDQVSRYYSSFTVLNGRNINGDLTVNENIADLGALHIISHIASLRKASRFQYQEMFSSFAKLWASQESEQYTKLLLLSDTHSPNKYRVNAVLSSTDKFYDIYSIYRWNKMYRRDRVSVW